MDQAPVMVRYRIMGHPPQPNNCAKSESPSPPWSAFFLTQQKKQGPNSGPSLGRGVEVTLRIGARVTHYFRGVTIVYCAPPPPSSPHGIKMRRVDTSHAFSNRDSFHLHIAKRKEGENRNTRIHKRGGEFLWQTFGYELFTALNPLGAKEESVPPHT